MDLSAAFVPVVVREKRSSRGSRTCTLVGNGSACLLSTPAAITSAASACQHQIWTEIGNLSLSELYQVFKMCCYYSTCTSTNLIRRWNGGLPQRTRNFPSVRTVAQLYHPLTGQHIDKALVRRLQGSNSQSLRD